MVVEALTVRGPRQITVTPPMMEGQNDFSCDFVSPVHWTDCSVSTIEHLGPELGFHQTEF